MERAGVLRTGSGWGGVVGVLGLVALGGAAWAEDEAGPWDVHLHEGRPYLTVEAIQRNYGFGELNRSTETFVLRGAGALVEGRIGAREIRVNRLGYSLHFAPVLKRGHRLVSAYDVTNLLDLLLRPGEHMRPGALKTVYIQTLASEGKVESQAREFAFPIQEILSDFGLVVRLLPEESGGVVGEGMQLDESGATAWLRLRGNANVEGRGVRCSVLAPPEAPVRGGSASARDRRAVYLGNLHDAESLALATLIQTGAVLGPAAREAGAVDGGNRQDLSGPFQRASGAAVQVEWGPDTDAGHLLKSVAAGLVRYRSFLASHAAWVARTEEERSRERSAALGDISLELDQEGSGLKVAVGVRKGDAATSKTSSDDLEVHCFVFTGASDGGIDLLETPPPRVTGGGPEEWKDGQGTMVLWYSLPAGTLDGKQEPSFGYVVRLMRGGEVLHTVARPKGLLNQLWRFTSLSP